MCNDNDSDACLELKTDIDKDRYGSPVQSIFSPTPPLAWTEAMGRFSTGVGTCYASRRPPQEAACHA